MSRPQVSIDRLPARRTGNEVRESMNCKSCRKRKIKCSRTRPSCESCTLFQCPCIYDAVPKKRGPKTDVLEALMKRVDGLEKQLQEEQRKSGTTPAPVPAPAPASAPEPQPETNLSPSIGSKRKSEHIETESPGSRNDPKEVSPGSNPAKRPSIPRNIFMDSGAYLTEVPNINPSHTSALEASSYTTTPPATNQQPLIMPDSVLDTFFTRVNEKPFYLLDEQSVRQLHRTDQLPPALSMAIYALTMRYTSWSNTSLSSLRRLSQNYASRARRMVDPDSPSLEGLQTLLILSLAFLANGQGKKSYLIFGNCISMAFALELHREVSIRAKMLLSERETRRRVFWTCYILDRFFVCGSKRPSLITDSCIALKLPSWAPTTGGLMVEGDLFHAGPNIRYCPDPRRRGQDAVSLLIDIARILGIANQYSAAGGVKGDSHFPWHSLSSISKIRSELDIWAASTQDVFVSIDALFGHPQASILLLSKLVYHLAHCIIYRPFLPMDLVELRGTGQHQSWQIEATSLCFSHANAIIELVEIGRSFPMVEWSAFVGHCIWTAGTVHIHGAHYKGKEGNVFAASSDYLMRGITQLSWLSNVWTGIQHHREMLQNVHAAHSELIAALSSNAISAPVAVFHLEGFFERYTGQEFDGSHVRLTDMPIEEFVDGLAPFSRNAQGNNFTHPRNASISSISPRSQSMMYSSGISGAFKSSPPNAALGTPLEIQQSLTQRMSQSIHSQAEQQQSMKLALSTAHIHDLHASTIPDMTSSYLQFPYPPNTGYAFPSGSVSAQQQQQQQQQQQVNGLVESHFATFPFEPRHQPHLDPSHPFEPISRVAGQQQQQLAVNTTGTIAVTSAQSDFHQPVQAGDTGVSEKDPFLSLLEQLVDDPGSLGGTTEMDYFLAGDSHVSGLKHDGHGDSEKDTSAGETQGNREGIVGTLGG